MGQGNLNQHIPCHTACTSPFSPGSSGTGLPLLLHFGGVILLSRSTAQETDRHDCPPVTAHFSLYLIGGVHSWGFGEMIVGCDNCQQVSPLSLELNVMLGGEAWGRVTRMWPGKVCLSLSSITATLRATCPLKPPNYEMKFLQTLANIKPCSF